MTQDQGTAAKGLRILSREQVSFYEEHGYVLVESAISDGWLDRLRAASQEFVEESRTLASSNRRLDVDVEMGPMGIVPGSHQGPLFDLYGQAGTWTGNILNEDLTDVDLASGDWLIGPAGSVTVHNCAAVHGSMPNESTRPRPLLLQTYSAADSFPLLGVGTTGLTGGSSGQLVGDGDAPRWLTIEGRTMPAAPDWSRGGYTTIFDQ